MLLIVILSCVGDMREEKVCMQGGGGGEECFNTNQGVDKTINKPSTACLVGETWR